MPVVNRLARKTKSFRLCLSLARRSCVQCPSISHKNKNLRKSQGHGDFWNQSNLRIRACGNNVSSLTDPPVRWISHSSPRQKAVEQQSSSDQNSAGSPTTDHQPPLPVRMALVSATTAMATPAFPALGFLYLVLRITVPDANLRKGMEGRWGSLLSFTTWTVLPKLYNGTVASLLLPCAVGNAVVAGGVYGLLDVACGGPNSANASAQKVLQTPWIAGSGIGAAVGYIAPNYVYGPLIENMYAMEGMSQSMQYVMDVRLATEVSVATGAIAGMILHKSLYYPINGIPGIHWGYFSGTALAALTSALAYVYYGRKDVGLPVPEGSFIEPSKIEIIDSITRYNNGTGQMETYSLNKQQFIGSFDKCAEGQKIADASRSYAKKGKAVFDDRLLAFVYNYWDVNTRKRYPDHIVNIKTREELQHNQDSMALTDASVAVILQDDSGIMKILASIDAMNPQSKRRKQSLPKFKDLKEVSVAIELLMTVKGSKQEQPENVQVPDLEQFIRKRCPGLVLYASEEKYRGESVESQLNTVNWEGPDASDAMRRWTEIREGETRRTWRNRGMVVATGVLLAIVGSIFQAN